jgi:methylenetetrahydrofolate reductase (NADPH)
VYVLECEKICGAGASIRALTSGKASLIAGLLKDSGPEEVVTQLAAAKAAGSDFEGVHLFAFGGFLKTTKWASAVQGGRFELNPRDGDFSVQL